MANELRPCPFCPDGGDLEVDAVRICEGWYTAHVLCEQCGAQMIRGGRTEQEAKAVVKKAWNRRANDGQSRA